MNELDVVKLLYDFQKQMIVLWYAEDEKLGYSSSKPISDLLLQKIKENKHDLVHFLKEKKVFGPYQIPYIFAFNLVEYPLSPAQERLWFLAQLQDKDNYIYNEPLTLTFDEHCDLEILRMAIKILTERYTCFRTLFVKDEHGLPRQIILQFQDKRVKSISTLSVESIDEQDLSLHLDTRLKDTFDLSTELAIRCYLYHLKRSNKYVLYILQHHIITDGRSIGLLLSEFYTIYNKLLNRQEISLPKVDIQYTDYALWSREYYKKCNLVEQVSYWKNKLEGFQTLQIQKDSPNVSEYRSSTWKYEIDRDLYNNLKLFSKKNKTTLFVTLLTAYYILLNRYSNQNDICIGIPISGRNLDQVKNTLGFFVNAIVLRAKIKNQYVSDFLVDINQTYIEGIKYQDLPFEMLVDSLGIDRAQDLSPIFQFFFAYQKFIIPDVKTDDVAWFDNNFSEPATKFDITFDLKETENRLIVSVHYKANLFHNETIQRMSIHYVNVLRQMVQFPERRINELNILTKDEYNNIIHKWNSTRIPYPMGKTINQFFEEYVEKAPDYIAVTYAGSSLSYYELNEKANKLANFIRMRYLDYYKKELNPETLIVISMERCLELMIAIIAVIKAGAAYVPIDVNYPEKRKRFILEDADAKLILIKGSHLAEFRPLVDNPEKILVIEKALSTKNLESKNLQRVAFPNNTVYVIYTSGSTGIPKGVCITHLSLNNFICSVASKINLTSTKKILTVSSFTFDMFCFDCFSSLCSGGTLVLTDNAMVREPNVLVNYIEEQKPDIVIATPSLWHMIIDKLSPSSKLTIISAGEPLHENLSKKLFERSNDVWDAYGPTETTIFSILKKLAPGESYSIGKPIPNVTAYILNENMQPVPIGVVGELYIGGDCLAKGYLNRPALTKERFIDNPFVSEGEKSKKINLKIYKTGDLVYWLPSGDIKYVGRNDFQVKISGHRIELEELELVLNQFPKLEQCFVHAIKSEMSTQLVVYYTAQNRIKESIMREYLMKSLPAYMMPHVFIYLEKFPLNNSGKIDIKNLPKPNQINLNESIAFPRNSIEKELSLILTNVLNLNAISVNKNIFDVGCDSLKSVQIQTKINNHFNSNIKVVDIFYYPTIEKLALLLNDQAVETENPYITIKMDEVGKKDDVAIIGYSCLFPMSNDIEEYWENIKTGRECVRQLRREECVQRGVSTYILNHKEYSPYAGVVSGIEMFDAEFWGLSERDALFMDPKMRLFLEQAWKAIESSGYIKNRKQILTGVFAGFGKLDYLDRLLQLENIKQKISYFDYSMLTASDYFLNRVAYLLGISGPLSSVDTACSSASVAIIEACEKLLAGKCELALVGGVNLCSADDFGHISFEGIELLSKDGHSRIFDERAGGIVRSDGVGVVVLKRLSEAIKDQDHIRAVIRGYGVSRDGMRKFGNMYPRLSSLKKCIVDAQQNLEQTNIDYVECHGMGFKLGELFEFDALRETFTYKSYDEMHKCILGSVKANIGHTGYASGIAQLIKVACMLEHSTIPPQINYENPYPEFNLDNEPFQVCTGAQSWQKGQDTLKRAGMTSFGIGGTNTHIILEEAPISVPSNNKRDSPHFIITLSAKSTESLVQMTQNLAKYIASHPESNMSDIGCTLHLAREEFDYRIAFVCHDTASCIRLLQFNYLDMQSPNYISPAVSYEQHQNLVFNCPDVTTYPTTISKCLYETETIYRDQVDYCAALLEMLLGADIRQSMSDKIYKSPPAGILKQSTYYTCISLVNSYAISRFLSTCGLEAQIIVGDGVGEYLAACLADIISVEDMFKLLLVREDVLDDTQIKALFELIKETQVIQSNKLCFSRKTGEAITIKTILDEVSSKDIQSKLSTITQQDIKKLISADFTCITLGKVDSADNLFSQAGISELMVCSNSSEVDDYAHILNIIAQLWLQGLTINWEALYSDRKFTLIDLPTYPFAKILIGNHQLNSENYEHRPIYAD